MGREREGANFDVVFAKLASDIGQFPDYESAPRGQKVRENIAQTLVLWNPRARLLNLKSRDANYGFAVGEFFWYWLGKQDLESMLYYNKRMAAFSDNGFTLNSAYGHRTRFHEIWYEVGRGATQWDTAKRELLRDPDSRRAVMVIARPEDFVIATNREGGSKDVPCTLSLQFFIRDNKLRLHTTMRSNDLMWGLTYDLFSFTLLQECMLLELRAAGMKDLGLGHYSHTAGSMHIYERHFQMASAVVCEYLSPGFSPAAPMEPISLEELASLAEYEEALRTGKAGPDGSSQFSGGVRWMAEQLDAHRRKRDDERGRTVGPGDGGRAPVV